MNTKGSAMPRTSAVDADTIKLAEALGLKAEGDKASVNLKDDKAVNQVRLALQGAVKLIDPAFRLVLMPGEGTATTSVFMVQRERANTGDLISMLLASVTPIENAPSKRGTKTA